MWLGLDGCKGRWAGCLITGRSTSELDYELKYLKDVGEVCAQPWEVAAIDTPLTFQNGEVRKADQEARAFVNPSTVFNAPSQAVVDAYRKKGNPKYSELCRINCENQTGPKGNSLKISKQSEAILPAIKQGLDIAGRAAKSRGALCIEAHPELAFAALCRHKLDKHLAKSAPVGFFYRVALLEGLGFGDLGRRTHELATDPAHLIDFVDAAACAYVAYLYGMHGVDQKRLCFVGTAERPIYYLGPSLMERPIAPAPPVNDLAERLAVTAATVLP